MKVLFCVLGLLLALDASLAKVEYPLNEVEFPTKMLENKALKTFIKMVEENHLNVTVIVSKEEHYNNHKTKDAYAMAFTFPVNSEQLKQSNMNKEQGKKFLKTATDEKLAARIVHHGQKGEYQEWTNYDNGVPETLCHKLIWAKNLEDFSWDIENYAAQHTFFSVGPDGKNETTKILTGNVQVEVVKSENFKEEELAVVKKVLAKALMTYEEEDVPEVVSRILHHKIEPKAEWNVGSDVGRHNYVDSPKWLVANVLSDHFLIYTV